MQREKYSATKPIQEEALEKVLIVMFNQVEVTRNVNDDIFQISRRIEENYPTVYIMNQPNLGEIKR